LLALYLKDEANLHQQIQRGIEGGVRHKQGSSPFRRSDDSQAHI
jgi:hypothetical protein